MRTSDVSTTLTLVRDVRSRPDPLPQPAPEGPRTRTHPLEQDGREDHCRAHQDLTTRLVRSPRAGSKLGHSATRAWMCSMPQPWRCISVCERARERETERDRAKVPRSSAPVERKRFLWFVRRPRSLVWLANTHSLDCVHLCFGMCLGFALPWIGRGA
eukprot:2847825-Prymnesium_polylepis.1